MRDGSDILDGADSHAGGLEGGDGGVTSGTSALDPDFEFNDAEFCGAECAFSGGPLSRKGGAFSGAFVPDGSGGIPAEGFAIDIGNGNQGIVKGRLDVGDALTDVSSDLFFT